MSRSTLSAPATGTHASTSPSGNLIVELDRVTKWYPNSESPAVAGIDLSIQEGEFFSILGSSGSGKTTTLRMIAGFEQPTSGHIEIFGERVEGIPP